MPIDKVFTLGQKSITNLWQPEIIRYTKTKRTGSTPNTIPTPAHNNPKTRRNTTTKKAITLKHTDLEQKKTTWNHS